MKNISQKLHSPNITVGFMILHSVFNFASIRIRIQLFGSTHFSRIDDLLIIYTHTNEFYENILDFFEICSKIIEQQKQHKQLMWK